MNLFELKGELLAVQEKMEAHALENEGDVSGFDFESLDEIQGEIDDKLLNVGAWIKNLKADSEAYKTEMAVMAKKKKVIDNKIGYLQKYITEYLTTDRKLEDTRVKLSWRKSSSVSVPKDLDPQALNFMHPEYVKKSFALDKKVLKDNLKDGSLTFTINDKEYEVSLSTNQNLQVK